MKYICKAAECLTRPSLNVSNMKKALLPSLQVTSTLKNNKQNGGREVLTLFYVRFDFKVISDAMIVLTEV